MATQAVLKKSRSSKKINLMQGDCLELMSSIPDGSVDMILCDLPYGTTACKWDTVIPFEPLWEQYKRVIKPNGATVLFGSNKFTYQLINSNYDDFRYSWVWVKNTQTGISLAKYQPMRSHEDILVVYSERPTYNPQMRSTESEIMKNHKRKGYTRGTKETKSEHCPDMSLNRTPFEDITNPSTVLKFDVVPNRSKERVHPTQKPVALLEYLIKTYTNEGETVLDNCAGSFSTGVACVNINRGFIGIEKDEKYFDIGVKRIKERIQCLDLKIEPMISMGS